MQIARRTAAEPAGEYETRRLQRGILRGRGRVIRYVGLGGVLLALAGCAGAHVSDIAAAAQPGQPPSEILVSVAPQPGDPAVAQDVAVKLQSDLIHRLAQTHVAAEPLAPGAGEAGAAILHVSIVRADPGNPAERLIVGFGLGSAQLAAQVELENPGASGGASLAFSTSSSSGFKPGLILPGGIALATGSALHFAIGGGIDLATNIRGGLDRPTAQTASAIVGQLKKYYASAGWRWPAEG